MNVRRTMDADHYGDAARCLKCVQVLDEDQGPKGALHRHSVFLFNDHRLVPSRSLYGSLGTSRG